MSRLPRIRMRCELAVGGAAAESDLRLMTRDDVPVLGQLFYAAYFGTVDYEGETEAEAEAAVAATLNGEFGDFIAEASWLAEPMGRAVSASFVTRWQGQPLLAFAVTAPEFQGRGWAGRCTRAAMHSLAALGYSELFLYVTEANTRAIKLYQKLGFVPAP